MTGQLLAALLFAFSWPWIRLVGDVGDDNAS